MSAAVKRIYRIQHNEVHYLLAERKVAFRAVATEFCRDYNEKLGKLSKNVSFCTLVCTECLGQLTAKINSDLTILYTYFTSTETLTYEFPHKPQ